MNLSLFSVRRIFAASVFVSALGGFSTMQAQGGSTHVAVNAAQVLRSLDDRMFGVNTAVWDGVFKSAPTLPLMQAADMRTLRFPGGSTSDTYDWQTNKSYATGTRTLNTWSWSNSFDDFAQVALSLHAQVFITANYGSGTAQQAADWVAYSNVTKNYGFKYWEIGNENYGSWEEDIHPAKWDPVTYANEAKDYIAKMKAVDPTIKIGVVVQTGEDNLDAQSPVHNVTNPRTGVSHHGWTAVMLATLKSLGVTPDYVIYHRYPLAPGSETDATLLAGQSQSGTTWADDAADLRRQVNDYLGAAGPGVEMVVTENNDVYSNPGKQSTGLVDGLFYADSFGQLLQTEFQAFVWWALHNGPPDSGNFSSSLYGWRTYGDYGMISQTSDPHPTYYAMKLISHFARAGDHVVAATSDNALLAAYAVQRTNGALALLVINKSPTATTSVSFTVSGYPVGATASVYSYGILQDDAARTGTGSTDLALSSLSGVGTNFQTSFAPYSASVITLSPAVPSAPAQPHAYASGATEVTLTWQLPTTNSSGIVGYVIDRATDSAFSQNVTSFKLGASTSYLDTTAAANTTYFYRISAANADGVSDPTAALQVKTLVSTPTGTASLVNISTRAYSSIGNNVTIAGFVISGTASKRVLMRAVGPTLTSQGIGASEVMLDPTLELHDASHGNSVIATNDNWGDNANAADITTTSATIGASALDANDTASAALLRTMPPGIYTLVVSGKSSSSGIVLVEVYDADPAGAASTFSNISSRADCATGNGVTIGGFVITGAGLKHVLVRAVGPTLTTQGIGETEVLHDPNIELHDAVHGNVVIATNDNWGDNANAAAITTTGARIGATPFSSTDTTSSALLLTLPPGRYSFVIRGQGGATGVVLAEVYDAD